MDIWKKIWEVLNSKRVKSFLWRITMMMFATGIDYTLSSLTEFNLSPEIVIVLGLILGEVSKAIRNKYATSK